MSMQPIRKRSHTELLAPAGSFDAARAAVNAGADAIYMGGPLFSARAYAESSAAPGEGPDMLMQAIGYCRLRGVRVFMTLNTLMKEKEMKGLEEYLEPYVRAGLDGVIVQDAGVMKRVCEHFPDLSLHISTQAAVTGPRYASRLRDAGADRVVLARELSLKEIRRIFDATGMEIEVFAHGALCYAYSGQCLMSSMIGGRSGNRGRCAGTCRLPYALLDENGRYLSRQDEKYLLSMKDLCTVSRLREMIEAGVFSFKIEGRMKSPVYVAAVTSVYRKYLDLAMQDTAEAGSPVAEGLKKLLIEENDRQILLEGFERGGMTDGYLDGHKGAGMITLIEKPELRIHNDRLISDIKRRYIDNDMKVAVTGEIIIRRDRPVIMKLRHAAGGTEEVTVCSDFIAGEAANRPLTEEDVRDKAARFGGTDFELKELKILLEENCFVPVRVINDLRRDAVEELRLRLIRGDRITDAETKTAGQA